MTGTPASCAMRTAFAIALPSCGTTTSTSTLFVSSFSTSPICTVSSPFAASTSTRAPSSPARCTNMSRSACQRASFSVSSDRPMLICAGLAGPEDSPPRRPSVSPSTMLRASETSTSSVRGVTADFIMRMIATQRSPRRNPPQGKGIAQPTLTNLPSCRW